MKKYTLSNAMLICLCCAAFATGCCKKNETQTTQKNVTETTMIKEDTAEVIAINTEDFCRLVFDFRNATSWEYLGKIPCVIDFYADWCKPCQMMSPIMEKLAKEFHGRIAFYKVNVDQNEELSNYFQIQGIPYFLFFPTKGEPIVKMGGMSEEEVYAKLEEIR